MSLLAFIPVGPKAASLICRKTTGDYCNGFIQAKMYIANC